MIILSLLFNILKGTRNMGKEKPAGVIKTLETLYHVIKDVAKDKKIAFDNEHVENLMSMCGVNAETFKSDMNGIKEAAEAYKARIQKIPENLKDFKDGIKDKDIGKVFGVIAEAYHLVKDTVQLRNKIKSGVAFMSDKDVQEKLKNNKVFNFISKALGKGIEAVKHPQQAARNVKKAVLHPQRTFKEMRNKNNTNTMSR